MISAKAHAPLSEQELAIFSKDIEDVIDISVVLPAWPFRRKSGNIDVFEFEMLFSWDFPVVLHSLAAMHGDTYVTLMAVDQHGKRIEPVWRITVSPNMAGPYGYVHYREPQPESGDGGSPLNVDSERIAIVGSSGSWSIWADRDWELGFVHSQVVGGGWLDQTLIPFANPLTAVDELTIPGYSGPTTEDEKSRFIANLRERGTLYPES